MSQLGTVYATKRRRRNGKNLKPPQKDGVTKSNPSKRHRERLNAELDTLASLLPFEQNILSKLDRLSILRLSVSYLRTKSHFGVAMSKGKEDSAHHDSHYRARELAALAAYDHQHLDGEMFLQALNGFLLILTCDGEVFFATHSIESYLGFHQSDIVHQSVYELVHSEDREELQRQLMWNSFLPAESANLSLNEALVPQHSHLLERSFTVRFRCLLDNTSGFLRLDIRGRVKELHGQNRKTEELALALFALCTPFGPPSLLEVPQKEVMFKSKHKLDLGLVSMDPRGKILLGYSDSELANLGGYGLVHYDDLAYVASAHQELLKTGASGMIAYRYQTKDGGWQWLQTSSRLVYKNSKPDFVISTHRPLMEEEGRDLLGKRTMDFKVSYLDAGLTNSYFSDSDSLGGSSCLGSQLTSQQQSQQSQQQQQQQQSPQQSQPQRVNRRYKNQLRDFLSTCRSKRASKASANHHSSAQQQLSPLSPVTGGPVIAATVAVAGTPVTAATVGVGVTPVDYLTADSSAAAAAVVAAAAYGNLNSHMYPTATYAPPPPPAATDPAATLGTYIGHTGTYHHHHHHQTLYPTTALDNRYLTATENLFQYRPLGSYYPDYHATTGYNGFIDVSLPPTYESHQQLAATPDSPKYGYSNSDARSSAYHALSSPVLQQQQQQQQHAESSVSIVVSSARAGSRHSLEGASTNSAGSSPATNNNNGVLTPKIEDVKSEAYSGPGVEPLRQTVLMWGAPPTSRTPPRNNGSYSPPTPARTPLDPRSDPLKSLQEMNSMNGDCKWKRTSPVCPGVPSAPSPPRLLTSKVHQPTPPPPPSQQHQQQHYSVVTSAHYASGSGYANQQQQNDGTPSSEVWQGVQQQQHHHQQQQQQQHHHYQYYPYQHHHHHHPTAPSPRHASHTLSSVTELTSSNRNSSSSINTSSATDNCSSSNSNTTTTTANNNSSESHYPGQVQASINSAMPITSASQILNRTLGVLCYPSLR
ncbi:protein single-minded isoform X1 [Copidosoma floridanum]|uniref:protein single-minded isoform X1 n=1 Tax=Copidosoma floridanum TaxID=29053 RepID=UPI000C6F4898|nr:protein single-minded isoform X1 [Copidosoma floridanum]